MICFHLPAPGREVIDSAARAHPASAGPENVQCRSVFIQFKELWFVSPGRPAPASNPFLTHGTVESPAKLLFQHFHCVVK
jgi:hypothetical protein